MNQRHCQNISRVSIDVSLVVENVTQDKYGTMIIASVNLESKQDVTHVKMITPGILVHVLASI